jgi:hypothetical protein
MNTVESKAAQPEREYRRPAMTYVFREWAAPIIVRIVVCGMGLAIVCALLGPAE